jgi:hypothetical protein
MILDRLASGALSLATVRLRRPHLTPENHEAVLAEASGRSRSDVLELIARLAPRPDVRLRRAERTEVRRDRVPGIPPRRSPCARRATFTREHLLAL